MLTSQSRAGRHSRQQVTSVSGLAEIMVLIVGSFAISYVTMGQMKG